jgi:hypothetical protein
VRLEETAGRDSAASRPAATARTTAAVPATATAAWITLATTWEQNERCANVDAN